MPCENEPPYQVHNAERITKVIRRLYRRAFREGRHVEFLTALDQIQERLATSPTTFGEPLYRLPYMRIEIRHAIVRPLVIDFAVSEERPVVFIKGVQLLPMPTS